MSETENALWDLKTFFARIIDEYQPESPLWEEVLAASTVVADALRAYREEQAQWRGLCARAELELLDELARTGEQHANRATRLALLCDDLRRAVTD